ncbi:MAG: CoA ester lyase [Desulfomonile tiedjei]|uniref:CoA ester lyase n=1 Tax=Desulfomonile tiedjei TaxID=2358 RepID=A0A9D6UYR0_9BACT|nr:CoA ester lyase [Desulfomonile tiedjei]
MRVQRSLLILPVNVPRFIEKAHLRGADAIVLDLEDSIPLSQKDSAREMVKESIGMVRRTGAEVFVRVNNDPVFFEKDVAAAVDPGLHAIFLPKVESSDDVKRTERLVARLESERGIEKGRIKLSLHIESPKGLMKMQEVLAAGTRIESMSLGMDDYCLELGVEPSPEGTELFLPLVTLVTVCKAAEISPIGILGSVAGYKDRDGFRKAAERGRRLGCTGAFCIHPDQVDILNSVFSPAEDQIIHAKRVVHVFEEALAKGRASTTLDDRMVDTPVYKRALKVLELAEAVAEKKRLHAEALTRLAG